MIFNWPIALFLCMCFIFLCLGILAILAQMQIHKQDKTIVRDIIKENRHKERERK